MKIQQKQIKRPPPPLSISYQNTKSTTSTSLPVNIKNKPSLGTTMIEGFAFGSGSSLGRSMIDSVFMNRERGTEKGIDCIDMKEKLNKCIFSEKEDCNNIRSLYDSLCKKE